MPPSHLTKQESKNSNLNKCGKVPMEPLETFSMVPSLENLSSSTISQDLFQDGKNPLLSEDTLLEINIELLILLLTNQELSKLFSEILKVKKKKCKSSNSKEKEVSAWVCTMLMKVLKTLLIVVSNLPFKENILFI